MRYISAAQAAKKWKITAKRVQVLCKEERIPGIRRVGRIWKIPESAEKPADARIKSGKYVGMRRARACCNRSAEGDETNGKTGAINSRD